MALTSPLGEPASDCYQAASNWLTSRHAAGAASTSPIPFCQIKPPSTRLQRVQTIQHGRPTEMQDTPLVALTKE